MHPDKDALILVDLQYDFLPGGPLGVPHGNEVVPVAQSLMPRFKTVVATQDWHPVDHRSFAVNNPPNTVGDIIEVDGLQQIMWPVHCVEDSPGARILEELDASQITQVFKKGQDQQIDSYSGFFDNGHRRATGLADWLKARGIEHVYVIGLALDYCVKFTVLDARQLGFETTLVLDGSRAVNLQPGDDEKAIEEMRAAGAEVVRSNQV